MTDRWDELREALENTSSEPWSYDAGEYSPSFVRAALRSIVTQCNDDAQSQYDMEFIVLARNAVPELLAEVVQLKRDLKDECERRDEIIATTTKLWEDEKAENARLREALSAKSAPEAETLKRIAMAICRVQLNGGDPSQLAVRWNGTEIEQQDFPAWRDFLDEARAAVAALKETQG